MGKTISIKKAKIIDGTHLELKYTETEPDGDASVSNDYEALCRRIVHPDMIEAYDKLKVHLAYLSEIVPIELGEDLENDLFYMEKKFEKFKVTSFSIGGEGDSLGVTLTGQMKLRGKKILNLNSPFTKFEEQASSDENYEYLHLLYSHVMTCINEVELYVGGKCAPNPQLDLFEGDGGPDDPKHALKEMLEDFKEKGLKVSVSDDGKNFTPIN